MTPTQLEPYWEQYHVLTELLKEVQHDTQYLQQAITSLERVRPEIYRVILPGRQRRMPWERPFRHGKPPISSCCRSMHGCMRI